MNGMCLTTKEKLEQELENKKFRLLMLDKWVKDCRSAPKSCLKRLRLKSDIENLEMRLDILQHFEQLHGCRQNSSSTG